MKLYLKNHIAKFIFFVIVFVIILLTIKYQTYLIQSYEDFSHWLYPSNKDRNGELFKVFLSILGAFGILFGLNISLRRAKAIEQGVIKQGEALNIQSEQIGLSRKSQTDERFKNAVEHLGSEKEPIIFGGIAELHQIAKENEDEYSDIIFNILCSYIRTNSRVKKNKSIIQTIADFLFSKSKDSPYLGLSANLKNSDLLGINFRNANLEYADLSDCRLSSISHSSLESAILDRTEFFLSKIENVNFTNSEVNATIFYGTEIKNCEFNVYQDYPTAYFIDGNLKKVKFKNVKMSDWNFIGVEISNTTFNNCEIISTAFSASCLHNVDFIDIELFSSNDFRATQFTSVRMRDFFITKSNFKGCRTERGFRSPFFKELSNSIGIEPDISGIDFHNTTLTNCENGKLTQEDIDEIIEKYEFLQEKIFKKKKPAGNIL